MKYKWDIKTVRAGEEQKYLDGGYEPFGISGHDTSYQFFNTRGRKYQTQHQTTDFIYLRRKVAGNRVGE